MTKKAITYTVQVQQGKQWATVHGPFTELSKATERYDALTGRRAKRIVMVRYEESVIAEKERQE